MTGSVPTPTPMSPGPAPRDPGELPRGAGRGPRWTAILLGGVGLVGILVALLWPVRRVDGGQPTCLFRLLLDLPCPGCGMTRAWVHAAHGDLWGALVLNPFGVLLMAMAAFAAGYVAYALVRRRPPERMLDWVTPRPAIALFSLWMVWSVYRMVSIAMGQQTWAVVLA